MKLLAAICGKKTVTRESLTGRAWLMPAIVVFALFGMANGSAMAAARGPALSIFPVAQPALASGPDIGIAAAATVSFTASPSTLPVTGGVIRLRARIHKRECVFRSPAHFKRLPARRPCKSGVSITIPANTIKTAHEYLFSVRSGKVHLQAHVIVAPVVPANSLVIVTQPTVPSTIALGQTLTLNAVAVSSPPPTAQWQSSANGGQTWGDVGNVTAGAVASLSFVVNATTEYRVVFANSVSAVASAAVAVNPEAIVTQGVNTSQNWSGYTTARGTFTSVTATWTVPALTCASTDAYSTIFAGIDGWDSDTVEQDGTASTCYNGIPSYYAWYEIWGDSALNNGLQVSLSNSYPIIPGDIITATTSDTPSGWVFTIVNATSHWSFTSPIIASPTPPPAQNSAEWIVEAPDTCPSGVQASCSDSSPLADFGAVNFSAATATTTSGTVESIAAAGAQPMIMQTLPTVPVTAPTSRSTPSALTPGGEGFSVTWNSN